MPFLHGSILQVTFLCCMTFCTTIFTIFHMTKTHRFNPLLKIGNVYNMKRSTSQPHHHSPTTEKFTPNLTKDDVRTFLHKPVINPFEYGYIHNERDACGNDSKIILFVVPSNPGNICRRQKIRESKLYQYVSESSNNAVLLFFIGEPSENETMRVGIDKFIQEEIQSYHDVIRINFVDVYRNIRLKAVSMLQWARTFCRHIDYVIRVDDDFIVDPHALVRSITRIGQRYDNFIVGKVPKNTAVGRDKNSKYYVPKKEYPHARFPTFALGGLLGYPYKTVSLLYQAALRVPPLWLDDVFITGMCGRTVNATLLEDVDFITSFVHTGVD